MTKKTNDKRYQVKNNQTDQQYDQERLTDGNAYSEYFEDDENKSGRYTDEYRENYTD